LDDVSTDGLALIEEIRFMIITGMKLKFLQLQCVTMHIVNCAKIGADVMTGPLAIYGLLKHPLTDIGLAHLWLISRKEINI
jgi:transaldolase